MIEENQNDTIDFEQKINETPVKVPTPIQQAATQPTLPPQPPIQPNQIKINKQPSTKLISKPQIGKWIIYR